MLGKDIPPAKMDLVRSLMQNRSILPDEKYRAIIELIQSCPDKPVEGPRVTSIEIRENKKKKPAADTEGDIKIIPPPIGPSTSGVYIDDLFKKYRKLKIFRKRYLAHSGNRLGVWFKKRLIPTKRLLSLMREIAPIQEKVFATLNQLLIELLKDSAFDDPSSFNYLSMMPRYFGTVPLSRYEFDAVKWMERKDFEEEMKDYTKGFLSYHLLTAGIKENLLQIVENKLRGMEGFNKAVINEKDGDKARGEKEKRNLAAEKKVFDYMLGLRSFLTGGTAQESPLSRRLESRCGIKSLGALLHVMNEALVFHRELSVEDIASYYRAAPPVVSDETYNYNEDVLKKFGKDDESRKNRKIEVLKEDLGFFEDIYIFLKFEISGENLLMKCFDDQWRLVDKRRGDSAEVFKSDFFSFTDGLINYFNNSLAHCIDGTVLSLGEGGGEPFEGRIFTESFFERELKALESIVQEIYYLRTNNPNLVVPYDELQRIFKGQIKSMNNIGALLRRTGGVFYQLGRSVHRVIQDHRKWSRMGKPLDRIAALRTPFDHGDRETLNETPGRPLPFSDCRVMSLGSKFPLARTLAGMPVINADFNDGILIIIVAFCYQLAYECGDENIQGDLENRKNILSALRDLANN